MRLAEATEEEEGWRGSHNPHLRACGVSCTSVVNSAPAVGNSVLRTCGLVVLEVLQKIDCGGGANWRGGYSCTAAGMAPSLTFGWCGHFGET